METELKLYPLILPPDDRMEWEELYVRKKGNVQRKENYLVFQKGAAVSFDTYFNGFSEDVWKTYTCLAMVGLRIFLSGQFRLRLCRMILQKETVMRQVLLESDLCSQLERPGAKGAVYEYMFPQISGKKGILYFELLAQTEGSRMDGAEYFTRISAKNRCPVKLAVGICTYKREPYLLKNLAFLSGKLAQKDSTLYGHMEIFVADNGQTLAGALGPFPLVHGFENPNLGGAAGFTRCMLEVLRANKEQAGFTHLLLMDDDVQLEWGSIEKTYALLCLLRPEYKDAWIAGAMLRMDMPYLQEESGGVFGAFGNRPLDQGLDMRRERDCLKNGLGRADYGAWWYCCVPVEIITETNLPLPLFIHGDDVEWGLRCKKPLVRMNGICVWHEPLETKACAERIYYNIRNLLICHALYGRRTAVFPMSVLLWKQFFHDAFLYQYAGIHAGLQGAKDFLKGPGFLKDTDAQNLHKCLLAMRGTRRDIRLLRRKIPWDQVHAAASYHPGRWERIWKTLLLNGCFLPGGTMRYVPDGHFSFAFAWHSRRLVFVDEKNKNCYVRRCSGKQFLRYFLQTFFTVLRLAVNYNTAAGAYRMRAGEMQTKEFWEAYLKLDDSCRKQGPGEKRDRKY